MDGFQLDTKIYFEVIRQTTKDLKGIRDVSVKDRAKDFVKSAMGRSVRTKDPLFWPAGMLMLGLVEARRSLIEKLAKEEGADSLVEEIDSVILKHLNVWKGKYGAKVDYIDDALAGVAVVRLYKQSYDEKLRNACKITADKIYAYLQNAARDKTGTIVYNSDRDSGNVFADGTGMVSMFLAAYGEAFEVKEALDISALQLLNFKKYGMDSRTGLPYHGYSLEGTAVKKGVLSWGRAAGWLIMGLAEFAAVMESYALEGKTGPDLNVVSELVTWYREFSVNLASYQKSDGGFAWQVQAVDGPLDTSATGMILYGLMRPENHEAPEVEKSLTALLESIADGKVEKTLSSCDDFGVHYQSYGHYPWGQGAVLAVLAIL